MFHIDVLPAALEPLDAECEVPRTLIQISKWHFGRQYTRQAKTKKKGVRKIDEVRAYLACQQDKYATGR